jgi:hypothetical protein
MSDTRSTRGRGPLANVVLAMLALALAGCASSAATPMTIYVALPTPDATPTVEPTAEATPTFEATDEPSPSPESSSTDSPSPSSSPTSPAAACTGTAEHQAYFVNAAAVLHFDVYCAVLPSGWWLQTSNYVQTNGGQLIADYTNNAGDQLRLVEGRVCDVLTDCLDTFPVIGSASYGGLAGTVRDLTGSGYMVAVNPHSIPGYSIYSITLSRAKLTQLAAALVRVSGA